MKLFSGLDYLKIDIANQFGKDKLLFEDRIKWFNDNISEEVVTMSNEELHNYVLSFPEVEEIPLAFAGLLAYQDYWFKRPNGYRVSFDAVCSGASLMSALTADIKGLDHTGLITERRGDLYTAVYERFKSICNLPVEATRKQFKDLVMQMLYGSQSVIKTTAMTMLGYDHGRLSELPDPEAKVVMTIMEFLVEAIKQECNGAFFLQQFLTRNWDSNTTKVKWILPDGFNVVSTNYIETEHSINIDGYVIPFKVKEEGTINKSVENCANSIHSLDGMIVREMQRRCSFDIAHLQEVLWYLISVPDDVFEIPFSIDNKLDELIVLYEVSKFCTIRITDYIHSLGDACRLSKEHRTKLITIIKLLIKQGNIDLLTVHDCFTCHPNNVNYIRHWYKEIIADIVESNVLTFLCNQFPNKLKDPISMSYRSLVAKQVRESNYGLC